MNKLYIKAYGSADVPSWGQIAVKEIAASGGAGTDIGKIKEGSVSFNDNGTEQTLYSTGHILEALKKMTEVEISMQIILPDAETLNKYVDAVGEKHSFDIIPTDGSIKMTANNAILSGTPMWAEDTGFYVDAKLRCTKPNTSDGKTFTFTTKS